MNRSMVLKLLFVSLITVVILAALAMINGTITDRQQYRDDAVKSIEASYAGPQTLIGPVLVRPYIQTTFTTVRDDQGKMKQVTNTASLNAISFPQTLAVHGQLKPSQRRHGLYNVTVYELAAHLTGSIEASPPQTTGTVAWGEPYLAMSVDDVRGFVGSPTVMVNGQPQPLVHSSDALTGWTPNLHIPLRNLKSTDTHIDFTMDINLGGTEKLSIAPIADSNHIELTSAWHSPLFDGQFLPRDRSVGPSGFNAVWDVPSLATGTQLQLQSATATPVDLLTVSLLTPIDPYKLSDRATKYGILFIILTFVGFFLFEIVKQLPIHPIQYLLVGFGLAIFFLLLISFSEHLPFAVAYLISSAACIGLLTFYLCYVLRSATRGLGFGAMLTTLYAAVYGLLISEDNALILGSLLLFFVLATIMVITRQVDWYKAGPLKSPVPPPVPAP